MRKLSRNMEEKKYYKIEVGLYFGNINFDYWEFKVEKMYKKTARVKTILELGCSHEQKVNVEDLDKYYFTDKEECFRFWGNKIQKTIEFYVDELKGYTREHKDYKSKINSIKILRMYKLLISDFSKEKYCIIQNQIKDLLIEDAKFNVGDRVKVKQHDDEYKNGVVKGIYGTLYKSQMSSGKIEYHIEFDNGVMNGGVSEGRIELINA